MSLDGKIVVLGVSSSIAVYKAAGIVSTLRKMGANVHVIMTENAAKMMSPIVFESLSNNRCVVDTFDMNFQWKIKHISLAKAADIFVVAPATANVIGKISHGICDDMLTTTLFASTCPKIIAPAMNVNMYNNPINTENMDKLKSLGYIFVDSKEGILACGDVGKGKLADEEDIIDAIVTEIGYDKDLIGKRVLVSAGATVEPIDSVRFITNYSTGKMGYGVAKAARYRGADVTLVLGSNCLNVPKINGINVIEVGSAAEMHKVMVSHSGSNDIIVMSAAVSDYRSKNIENHKIKKNGTDGINLELIQNPDILADLGQKKTQGQVICGFAMETDDLISNATKKLESKRCDMIVANDLGVDGAGFGVDTNIVSFITKDGVENQPIMTKDNLAHKILDRLLKFV